MQWSGFKNQICLSQLTLYVGNVNSTSFLSYLSVALPEQTHKWSSVVRSCMDVAVLAKHGMVSISDTVETK